MLRHVWMRGLRHELRHVWRMGQRHMLRHVWMRGLRHCDRSVGRSCWADGISVVCSKADGSVAALRVCGHVGHEEAKWVVLLQSRF